MSTQIKGFRGDVHQPGDVQYDAQRAAFNPNLDARPVLVAEATGPSDVRAALAWARGRGVPFAVQATGHGTHVPADGALLVKTSRMATVLVDPDRRIARVGPGARWADVIAAAAPVGLAPLSGSAPGVGVAGYTFGGGLGLLSRKYGFAADSLVRADVVTADGQLVTASRDRNAELFWALRGGGGNFGVATSLEVRLYPVASVYAGVARFPVQRAADTLAFFRSWTSTVPDELNVAILLEPGPTFAVKVLYVGEPAAARRVLRPLWNVAGPAVSEDLRVTAYGQVKMPSVAPRSFELYRTLPDAMIENLVGSEAPVEIKHWGGAMAHGDSPVGHRDVPFSVAVNGSADTIKEFATGGSFLNFLKDPAAIATAYTPQNYERLRDVKRAYDPDNVFHVNLNIAPAHAELLAVRS